MIRLINWFIALSCACATSFGSFGQAAFKNWSEYEYFHVSYRSNTWTTTASNYANYMTYDAWGHVPATKAFLTRKVGAHRVLPEYIEDWPEEAIENRHRVLFVQVWSDGNYSSSGGGTSFTYWRYLDLTNVQKALNNSDYNGNLAIDIFQHSTALSVKGDHVRIQEKWERGHLNDTFNYNPTQEQLRLNELEELGYSSAEPEVRSIPFSLDSIKDVLEVSNRDCVHGIYRLAPGAEKRCGKYHFGVFNHDGEDVAVLTQDYSSGGGSWKAGEVKATFIPTAVPTIYIVDWLTSNKRAVEGYAECEGGILTIDIPQADENFKCSYVRTFPLNRPGGNQTSPSITTSKAATTPESAGSAVVIDAQNRFVVTNYHVVEDGKVFRVEQGGELFDAVVLKTDPDNDLALLKIIDSGMQLTALAISMDDKLGDRVFSAGYPRVWEMGDEIKVTEGVISSMSFLSDPSRFQTSVPITNGNSGGALLDEGGNLVGITQGGWRPDENTENVNAAVKSFYVISLAQTESTCVPILTQRRGDIDFSNIEESVLPLFVYN